MTVSLSTAGAQSLAFDPSEIVLPTAGKFSASSGTSNGAGLATTGSGAGFATGFVVGFARATGFGAGFGASFFFLRPMVQKGVEVRAAQGRRRH